VIGLRWRAGLTFGLVALLGWLTMANFVPKERRLESPFLPDEGLRLGLDLQGGIHWVVGVKLQDAVLHELEYVRDNVVQRLQEKNVKPASATVQGEALTVQMADADGAAALRDVAGEFNILAVRSDDGRTLVFGLTPAWEKEVRQRTMLQVLEVLRRRIDDPVRGIPDSVVTRQGDDRVLVQIPGGQIDRQRARELLKSTGFLEFKIVKDQAETEELLKAHYANGLPPETEIVYEVDRKTSRRLHAYLVRTTPDLTGALLADARVGFDRQQRAIVNFTFTPQGGDIFRKLTGEHIGDPLAVILDGRVYSAPVIRSQIGSRGQIEGRFSPQEAADLAVVLRAGSLSVPVVIEEERSIGPALGQDSIDAGVRASVLGLVLIVAFMIGYYRLSGGYASVALFCNMLMLVGLMSVFEATLTLPGIAGLVLTLGMAVDSNVIVFERIREELRAGRQPRAAVNTGFNKALWTVLDANITTLITALVLFEYGTGPIKGFAVTLSVGLVTSVFTALAVTRLLYQIYPGTRPVEQLSI
jgi:preprotein translocase subunit SecD